MKSDTGSGRIVKRKGELEISFPRGFYDAGETGETDVIISRCGSVLFAP